MIPKEKKEAKYNKLVDKKKTWWGLQVENIENFPRSFFLLEMKNLDKEKKK